jgi:hypothetical protein
LTVFDVVSGPGVNNRESPVSEVAIGLDGMNVLPVASLLASAGLSI